ncbi:TY-Chap domain-containing protein [Streptomyces sp. cg28]|uniref:TY-Chap domain-containing protein n=1 Tax=Streptomyces sp. cg28 TaxID=3403457 RepID=UPI003B20CEB8
MENKVPRGSWLDDDIFRAFVREVAPLRPGSWSLSEFARATSALGWEPGEPRDVAGQVWRRFAARKGPSAGYGTLIADASEPEQVRRLDVRVVDLPDEDVRGAVDRVRAAWWVMEEELGPPAMWGGCTGPWMLWRQPDPAVPALLVHAHGGGEMSLALLPPDADADTVGHARSRGRWQAAEPTGRLSAPSSKVVADRPATTWEEVEKRLCEALRSLSHDTAYFPGRFILHLGVAQDPRRFVQCWSQDLGIVIEATGHANRPDAADPARMARRGWENSRSMWQRRFPYAMEDRTCAETAARMLAEELRQLGADPAELSYDGTMTGRGQGFHLDLPDLGIPRLAVTMTQV